MYCSELNCQGLVCIKCYDTHDENKVTFLVQPYSITIELNLEEDDQSFDVVVCRCIDDIEDNEQNTNDENDDICDNDSNNSKNYDKYEKTDNSAQGDAASNTSDLDNFVTTTHDPGLINEHDDPNIEYDYISTTNARGEAFEVIEEIQKVHYVSGCVVLNQCGFICS